MPVDDYYNRGSGPRQLQDEQELRYPLSECMTCGCCLEACPQYVKAEVPRLSDESDEEYTRRSGAYYDQQFVGAAPISQAMLFNDHSTGAALAGERLDALMGPGGIQVCGNAQNCVSVCPKEIPLTTSIARAGRQTTLRVITRWFDR